MRSNKYRGFAKCILCFMVLLSYGYSYTQSQISFRQLSVKEGLSQNSAISIVQDSTGYLWIATQDGLNKYDGRKFSFFPYAFVDITKSNYSNLGKVYSDKEGRLWIIPDSRIPHKYDVGNNTFKPLDNVDDASVLYQSTDSTLWIGTYSQGLYALAKGAKSPTEFIPSSKIPGTVYNIFETQTGELLLASDGGITKIDPITKKAKHTIPITLDGGPILQNFSDIVEDHTGVQWIGTFGDGLYFKNPGKAFLQRISDLTFTDPLPENLNILDLHADTKNRLWIATYGRGLYMIDFKKHEIDHFNVDKHNPRAIHYKDVLCIYEDYTGTIWFGTDGGGISYYDEFLEKFNSYTNYQTPESISIDVVRAIAVDQDKSVWIGTSGKGLTQYDPKSNSWRTFKNFPGDQNTISSDRIMSLYVDEQQDLWVGTQGGGLNIYDKNERFTVYDQDARIPLPASTIWTIHEDSKGNKWLGTRDQGLLEFDKEKGVSRAFKKTLDNSSGPPSNNIRVITSDPEGNLWIGTEKDGIARFDPREETFKLYSKTALSNSSIKSLYYDSRGFLWIGTSGGGLNVLELETERFYAFTTKDGLANNVIYAILPDAENNLWLSSNKGITKFDIGLDFKSPPNIVNYNNYDGLATEFNTGAYFKDHDGNLYFGGLEGFYWFKPDEIKENSNLPKTTITGLEVSNEPYPMSEGMRLKHDQNTLSFTFSSLQYSLPEKNQYQYRLISYDKDWVHAENNNFARYSFLPPGVYEFQVKSSNYDGVWNEEPVSLRFSILAPWYLTYWAKAIYAVLIGLLVVFIYRYLKWRWRMKLDLRLKEEETLRLKKLNNFKSKLYTDISHEFRTPLSLISGPIEAKLGEGGLSDSDYANFSMIKRNTNRLIALVDQLLHLAKLEKGRLTLNVAKGNLELFLKAIASSFEYKAGLKKIDYTVEVHDLSRAWYDEDAIEKVTTNLLSNAIKYCPEEGSCTFRASRKGSDLNLMVINTLDPKDTIDQEKLFTRFYQQDEYAEGAGVGLSLVKELVGLHKGEVGVQIHADGSIEFFVRLPVEREAFSVKELKEVKDEKIEKQETTLSASIDLGDERNTTKNEEAELPLVLVVEDHEEVRDFLASVWQHKYRVFHAENGKIGIERALEIVPDLVLTDVRMPICDGITLCNTLKTDERTSHIPIILLTAGLGEEDELKGLQSGADDFITKPFKLRILEKRVENLIQTRQALRTRYSQEVILKAKDIAITPTDEVFINRMQKVLDVCLSDPDFNAARFCKELGMSRMQLHRKLLAFTGLSTTAFIRSQRLKQALQILQTSDASISEIAYAVGFNTPSYFIKCFKETYKKTPSEYLQSSGIE
ncbi:MAG: two-component regulator propeller domain-containing protein [Flavobacteriaceae bacterium]